MSSAERSEQAAGGITAATLSPGTDAARARRLRRRSVSNLLKMGHCAPTIMQTVLDDTGLDAQWLVKLLAAMPGGIGNTGGECGGVTAPLVLLGLQHRDDVDARGVPVVVTQGRALLQHFVEAEHTTACRAIRGEARVPLRCIKVIREAPVLAAKCLAATPPGAPAASLESHVRLFAFWRNENFHCAHAVLRRLEPEIAVTDDLLAATSGFVGGTVMAGLTCSALAAGVMALGLAQGEIENSRARVLRMIATMAAGGDAFADDMNAFNRVMNRGHELARECAAEFGTMQCRRLTGCNFDNDEDVQAYIGHEGIARCRQIAEAIADKVRRRIRDGAQPGVRGAAVDGPPA